MIFLSFNARGIGGPQKKLSLKRLLLSLKPDILFLQETMCSGEDAIKIVSQWLKNWSFSAVDAEGLSGGLLSGWSSDFKALSSSSALSSISVKLKHKDYDFSFTAINIYGPYSDRVQFWENLKSAGVFSDPLTVIGGDLNFTLSLREVWGSNPREDRHKGFFPFFHGGRKPGRLRACKTLPYLEKLSNGE
jgi:exonuclease III